MSLDLLARVSVLEGIAGVKPGTWMRNIVPEKKIVEVFGPGVRETWLSARDSGLLVAVRRSIEPLLKNTSVSADDILQPAIVGLGASGEVSRMPLFHGVGKAPGFTVAKVLGRTAANALSDLGISPTGFRFEIIRGKLNLFITTK